MRKAWLFAIACLMLYLPGAAAGSEAPFGNRADLVSYLNACAMKAADKIYFTYTSNLDQNIADRDWMSNLVFEAGIKSVSWSNNQSARKVELSKITYYPEYVEFARKGTALPPRLNDLDGVRNLVSQQARKAQANYVFYYSPALDGLLSNNKLEAILYSRGVSKIGAWEISRGARRIELIDLSYFPEYYAPARNGIALPKTMGSMDDLANLIREHALKGTKELTFYFLPELRLQERQDAVVDLLFQNGISKIDSWEISEAGRRVHMTGIYYEPLPHYYCDTPEDVQRALRASTDKLLSEFTILMNKKTFDKVSARDFELLKSFNRECAMINSGGYYSALNHRYTYRNVEYYPGMRALVRHRVGSDKVTVSDKDMELMKLARRMVSNAQKNSTNDYELLLYIFEDICARTAYMDNDGKVNNQKTWLQDHDTAYGALMNGHADCDGYADALYLLGNMAGLDVRYQQGKGNPEYSAGSQDDIGHMWNLVRLDNQWYMTDVTWGDEKGDGSKNYDYMWLAFGADQAAKTHIWNKNIQTVQIAPSLDQRHSYFWNNNLQFDTLSDASQAIVKLIKSGKDQVRLLLINGAYTSDRAFVESFHQADSAGISISYSTRFVGNKCFLSVSRN